MTHNVSGALRSSGNPAEKQKSNIKVVSLICFILMYVTVLPSYRLLTCRALSRSGVSIVSVRNCRSIPIKYFLSIQIARRYSAAGTKAGMAISERFGSTPTCTKSDVIRISKFLFKSRFTWSIVLAK